MPKRIKTKHPGVFFREVNRIGGPGMERVFYIVFKKDGKTFEEKVGRQFVDDMTPARAARIRAERVEGKRLSRKQVREEQAAAKAAEESRWTIAKLWDEYCLTFPENKVLRHEQLQFNRYLRADIGAKEPSELLPLDIDRLRIQLQKKGLRTTAARVLELLRRTVNFGAKKALVPPIQFKIEVPRLNNVTTEDLTPEQLVSLLQALDAATDQIAANIMRLALHTGMRRGEILKLRWADIDWSRGFITLVDPKGGQNQQIPFNDTVRNILKNIPSGDDNPFVFPGRKEGTHLTECRKGLTSIAAAAGLPKGFRPLHGLRHVYASMLASSGQVDMYTLQKLLTHKSPQMTERYIHLRDESLRKASDLAGNIIGQAAHGENKVVHLPEKKDGK